MQQFSFFRESGGYAPCKRPAAFWGGQSAAIFAAWIATGINYYSSHKMRFYAVTAQAKAGVDIDTIRYNSGHLHLETTLGYIRRANNEAENSEKWDEIFG